MRHTRTHKFQLSGPTAHSLYCAATKLKIRLNSLDLRLKFRRYSENTLIQWVTFTIFVTDFYKIRAKVQISLF